VIKKQSAAKKDEHKWPRVRAYLRKALKTKQKIIVTLYDCESQLILVSARRKEEPSANCKQCSPANYKSHGATINYEIKCKRVKMVIDIRSRYKSKAIRFKKK
jgi:hypothetical protein